MTDITENSQRVVVVFDRSLEHESRSGKEYGSWSERWSCSITAVKATDEEPDHEDDVFLIGPGDTAYVIAVKCSQGDSYGTADGKLECVHAFADKQAAQAAHDIYAASEQGRSFTFKDDFGREIRMGDPAVSSTIFDTREEVEILEMAITR